MNPLPGNLFCQRKLDYLVKDSSATDMALSPFYSDIDTYLNDVFMFLKEFEWIYSTSNTEFVVAGTLDQIPVDWKNAIIDTLSLEELNEIPFDYINESWPLSFQKFIVSLKRLKPFTEHATISTQHNESDQKFLNGIKPKKLHEIRQLSNEISNYCANTTNSEIFIDLGTGIGHLTNFLHRKFQYKILGIEANSDRVRTAKKLQETTFPESLEMVKFVQHYIETSSEEFIRHSLVKELNMVEPTDLVLTGLHACGDLTVTTMKLFLKIPNVTKMLIMPCCYHKMKFKMNSSMEFENVPLSQRVKSFQYVQDIVNRPFLRLAGQQTATRWRNVTEAKHRVHGQNMFIRGVVQAILNEDEMVTKNRQENSQHNQFSNELSQYTLLNKQTRKQKSWSNNHELAFNQLLAKYPNGANLSEFLTCLQASIQSLCENVVLLDRIWYVKEEAMRMQLDVNISVKKIVNEDISPRCFVIIAEKNK